MRWSSTRRSAAPRAVHAAVTIGQPPEGPRPHPGPARPAHRHFPPHGRLLRGPERPPPSPRPRPRRRCSSGLRGPSARSLPHPLLFLINVGAVLALKSTLVGSRRRRHGNQHWSGHAHPSSSIRSTDLFARIRRFEHSTRTINYKMQVPSSTSRSTSAHRHEVFSGVEGKASVRRDSRGVRAIGPQPSYRGTRLLGMDGTPLPF
jgi:hypothetical protein